MSIIHVVQGGQTPADVAKQHGSTVDRLVKANPDFPKVKALGAVGSPTTFDPSFWRDGVQVHVPTGAGQTGAPDIRRMYPSVHKTRNVHETTYPIVRRVKPGYAWHDKIPNGNYTWLAYMSQRIWAAIEYVAGTGGLGWQEDLASDHQEALASGQGALVEWMKTWDDAALFAHDMIRNASCHGWIDNTHKLNQIMGADVGPPATYWYQGLWFNDPHDVTILAVAALLYSKSVPPCPPGYTKHWSGATGPSGARGTNTPGPTFTVGAPAVGGTVANPFIDNRLIHRGSNEVAVGYGSVGSGSVGVDPGLDPYVVDEDEDAVAQGACSLGVISDVKEYRYEIQEDDGMGLASITEKWGLPARKWLELGKANPQIPGKYYGSGSARHCEPDRSKLWAGRLLKVPKIWPDPPEALWSRLKNPDGTPYTPGGGGGGGGGGEGEEGIDPVKWFGDDASSTAVWAVVIIAAAALGGAVLMGTRKKGGSK